MNGPEFERDSQKIGRPKMSWEKRSVGFCASEPITAYHPRGKSQHYEVPGVFINPTMTWAQKAAAADASIRHTRERKAAVGDRDN